MNNKRSKLLIGVLIAAAVVAAVLVGLITHKDVNEVRPETSCKYIVNGDTFTFSKDVVMSCDDKTGQILISDGDKSIETYAMPLYAESKDMLYLTKNMAYYRQSEGNTFAGKRLTALTSLSIIGNTVTISKNDSDRIESDGFLYDGSGAYVFIEPVKITVGENEINLPGLSYAKVDRLNWIETYNAATGKYTFEELGGNKPVLEADSGQFEINLDTGIVNSNGKETMLQSSAECFNNYFE